MTRKITVSNDTFATNPANVKLKPLVWFHYNPIMVSVLALLVVASFIAMFYNLKSIVFVILTLGINFLYWTRIKEHFQADSNPGLVVDTYPTLIAVHTNLGKGFGYYPVIKIIKAPKIREVTVGDWLPTVALYQDSGFESSPHWADFNPLPLAYASNDQDTIQSAMLSYSDNQINELQECLSQIEPPYSEGLYPIYTKDSNWDEL